MSATLRRAAAVARLGPRWAQLLASRPVSGAPSVCYGRDHVPSAREDAYGGLVKLQQLDAVFPNTRRGFNVLYLGSNTLPVDVRPLLALARRRGVPVVWNQDGVAYPAWHGLGWERLNEPMARGLREAAFVFFQSEFCRVGAERFLGARDGPSEVLYNAVDTSRFTPTPRRPERPLTLLLTGSHQKPYRVERALRTLALVARDRDTVLVLAGRFLWGRGARDVSRLAHDAGVAGRVRLAGAYSQADAPALYQGADVLLHTQYNDACPTVVIEAMACGLPVVHSASGGVPELVGEGAGVGVPAALDWEQEHPPAPEELATAVHAVAERLADRSAAARERAVSRFDLAPWLERHRRLFDELAR